MTAVSANKTSNYPFYSGYLSPYIENKRVRYSLYTLSILAVGAAAVRYGNIKVGFTLASAGCFAQGYQIVQLSKEIKNTAMDEDTKNRKISRITDRIFTMGLIWGIIVGGLNLSLIYEEGSLLLKNADLSLLQTPARIPYAWLQNAPSLIYHANTLASIGCFAIPKAYSFIYHADDLFFGKKQLANDVHALCGKLLNIWIAIKEESTLHSLLWMSIDMLRAAELRSYLSRAFNEASPQATAMWDAFKNLLTLFLTPRLTFQMIHDWISSFSNPPSSKAFVMARKYTESKWEITKYVANYVFFHTLNVSLLAARLYYHRFPTAIYFGLGLVYPTAFQKEMTIRRTWECAPDFIRMPMVSKCRYLFDRFSAESTALAWWNIPGACLNGLYLAEDFRFYGRRVFQ